MNKEQFILAVNSGGVDFAIMDWILHCTSEEFLHLWPLMEQEYKKISSKANTNLERQTIS